MDVLLLGSSGQLGKTLLPILEEANLKVSHPNREILDLNKFEMVEEFVRELKPKWIINCAAWTDVNLAEEKVSECLKINAELPGILANIANDIGSCLIHISTDFVFDGNSENEYRETDLVNPLNTYGKSKLLGEEKILDSGLEQFMIIRTSWLYSQWGKNFPKTMILKALQGEQVNVVSDQVGKPTNASDLASQILYAIQKGVTYGVYHYSNQGEISWFDFAKRIYELAKVDTSLVQVRNSEDIYPVRPKYSSLSLTKWIATGGDIRDWNESLTESFSSLVKEVKVENGI